MILEEFLAKNFSDLLKSKRLVEMHKVGDPRYFKFHRVLGHRTSKYFIWQEKILRLLSEGKIIIDQDGKEKANNASLAPNQKKCCRSSSIPNTTFLRFGNLVPIKVGIPRKTPEDSKRYTTTMKLNLMVELLLLIRSGEIKESFGYNFLRQEEKRMM